MRTRWIVVSLAGLLAVGGLHVASARIPSASGEITACVKKSGALKVIDADQTACQPKEQTLTWNQPGPPGPAGLSDTKIVTQFGAVQVYPGPTGAKVLTMQNMAPGSYVITAVGNIQTPTGLGQFMPSCSLFADGPQLGRFALRSSGLARPVGGMPVSLTGAVAAGGTASFTLEVRCFEDTTSRVDKTFASFWQIIATQVGSVHAG